jgi:hypothetical protein
MSATYDFKEQYTYIQTNLELSKTIIQTYKLNFTSDMKWEQNSKHPSGFQSGMTNTEDSALLHVHLWATQIKMSYKLGNLLMKIGISLLTT